MNLSGPELMDFSVAKTLLIWSIIGFARRAAGPRAER